LTPFIQAKPRQNKQQKITARNPIYIKQRHR